LTSESQANDLIRNAKLLRDADNVSVRESVYINRDVTKEEAKAAYEKRQARRAGSSSVPDAATRAATTLSAAAPAFSPPTSVFNALQSHIPSTVSAAPIDLSLQPSHPVTNGRPNTESIAD
jgi:hypothetical protein